MLGEGHEKVERWMAVGVGVGQGHTNERGAGARRPGTAQPSPAPCLQRCPPAHLRRHLGHNRLPALTRERQGEGWVGGWVSGGGGRAWWARRTGLPALAPRPALNAMRAWPSLPSAHAQHPAQPTAVPKAVRAWRRRAPWPPGVAPHSCRTGRGSAAAWWTAPLRAAGGGGAGGGRQAGLEVG